MKTGRWLLYATTGRIKSIRAKGSRTGLGIRKSDFGKWLVNSFILLPAGSEFEADCFMWQMIYLSPAQRNLLSHQPSVMLARCAPGNDPCRMRRSVGWNLLWTDGRWQQCCFQRADLCGHGTAQIYPGYLQCAAGRDSLGASPASKSHCRVRTGSSRIKPGDFPCSWKTGEQCPYRGKRNPKTSVCSCKDHGIFSSSFSPEFHHIQSWVGSELPTVCADFNLTWAGNLQNIHCISWVSTQRHFWQRNNP